MARSRKKRAPEPENHERWLVSYADFVTLLFAFFTAMYAISSINESKYKIASHSIAKAFNPAYVSVLNIIEESKFVEPNDRSIYEEFQNTFSSDYKEIVSAVKQVETDKQVAVIYEKNKVTIRLPDGVLFGGGNAELMDSGLELLDEIGRMLKRLPNSVKIEGHTDNIPISTDTYPSNWELSSDRALNILKYFISKHSIKPARLSATGFGEFRPVASNSTLSGRTKNRRVDLLILALGHDR